MSSDNVIRIRKHLHDELTECQTRTPTGSTTNQCVIRETAEGKYDLLAAVGQKLDHERRKRTIKNIHETEHFWELELSS